MRERKSQREEGREEGARAHLRETKTNSSRHLDPSIPISSSSQFPSLVQPVLPARISQDCADLVDLIHLALTREDGLEVDELGEDRSQRPHIHRRSIVSTPQQHLGSSVPPRRNVLGVRRFRVDFPRESEVGELDDDHDVRFHPRPWWYRRLSNGKVVLESDGSDEEVLWLHVSMEVA